MKFNIWQWLPWGYAKVHKNTNFRRAWYYAILTDRGLGPDEAEAVCDYVWNIFKEPDREMMVGGAITMRLNPNSRGVMDEATARLINRLRGLRNITDERGQTRARHLRGALYLPGTRSGETVKGTLKRLGFDPTGQNTRKNESAPGLPTRSDQGYEAGVDTHMESNDDADDEADHPSDDEADTATVTQEALSGSYQASRGVDSATSFGGPSRPPVTTSRPVIPSASDRLRSDIKEMKKQAQGERGMKLIERHSDRAIREFGLTSPAPPDSAQNSGRQSWAIEEARGG